MPVKMLGVVLSAYGPASNLEVVYCNLPQSIGGELKPTEVLVEIHAASVNPTDCKARKGTLANICPLKLPSILGIDLSGRASISLFSLTRTAPH
jgi:NADPH:quinone reductase-like Zn-dependent oxidoreductase